MNIIFCFERCHIGDMLFTKSFIKQFCENNKNDYINIYSLMRYNYFIFNDIYNLNIIKPEHNYNNNQEYIDYVIKDNLYISYLNKNKSQDYLKHINIIYSHNFINNNYLIFNNNIYIKLWIGYYPNDLKNIECVNNKCNQYYNSIVNNINSHIKNEYKLKLIDNCDLLPSIPYSNIDNFLLLKEKNKIIFYYNFEPKSGQLFPYNHEDNIIYLSNKFSDYIICCSLKCNYKSNNIISLEDLDYIIDDSCENIVKSYYCALNSDIVILFDIGSCFYKYFNNDFNGKCFHLSKIDYYYNKFIENIKNNEKYKLIGEINEIEIFI